MSNGLSVKKTGNGGGSRWLMVLFSLPFVAVGVGVIGWLVLPALLDWQAMKSWQPVTADVLSAELTSHESDNSTTWTAKARYRYEWQGSTYESDRISLSSGSDNIGSYWQDIGAELENHESSGSPITVFVNPDKPDEAIYDRNLRPGLLAMLSIFGLLFGGIGFAILLAGLFGSRSTTLDVDAVTAQSQPWLTRPEWASNVIHADTRSGARAAWFMALVWCAISGCSSIVIPAEIEKGNWAVLLILLFDVVGIGLLVWATRLSISARKFGDVPLTMDPHPGSIGGDVAGYIDVPLMHDPSQAFHVSLTCMHTWVSGSGKNRSTSHDARWQDEKTLIAEPLDATHSRLWFRFEPPAGLPVSEESSDNYHHWQLRLTADVPGVDLDRDYEIPVFATAKRSLQAISNRVRESTEPDLAAIEERTNFRQVPGGAAMTFRAGRDWFSGLVVAVVFGGAFGGAGIFILFFAEADIVAKFIFGSVFPLIGIACISGGAWMMGNGLEVEANDGGISIRRYFFGIPVWKKEVPRSDVLGVGIVKSSTQTTGTHTVVKYDLAAKVVGDNIYRVGDGFEGVTMARLAGDSFARYARFPYIGEIDSRAAFAARKAAYLLKRRTNGNQQDSDRH